MNNEFFRKFSSKISQAVGSPLAFCLAFLTVIIWFVSGPTFNFSNTWQLVINTGTTIVTFLMVFLIQNTQNRDSRATHIKIDELIRSTKTARNEFVNLEEVPDEQLDKLQAEFKLLHDKYTEKMMRIEEIKARKKK